MYWLQPPPYLRRAGAVLIVVAALAWDLAAAATEPYPVAARPIAAGSHIEPEDVAWIDLPRGLLPAPDLEAAVAAVDIAAGEAFGPALSKQAGEVPAGWWVLPITLGTLAAPGDEALLVVADPPLTVVGRVLSAQVGDPYDLEHVPAAVAVPADSAALVAAAQQAGLLVTAIRPAADGG